MNDSAQGTHFIAFNASFLLLLILLIVITGGGVWPAIIGSALNVLGYLEGRSEWRFK